MCFHEGAAVNLFCVPSGHTGVQPVHPAKAVIDDGVAPMEGRFNVEMTHAATGMRAEGASALVNRLLDMYEDRVGEAPQGRRYQECYGLRTGKPTEAYVRLYAELKEDLAQMGVSFRF